VQDFWIVFISMETFGKALAAAGVGVVK